MSDEKNSRIKRLRALRERSATDAPGAGRQNGGGAESNQDRPLMRLLAQRKNAGGGQGGNDKLSLLLKIMEKRQGQGGSGDREQQRERLRALIQAKKGERSGKPAESMGDKLSLPSEDASADEWSAFREKVAARMETLEQELQGLKSMQKTADGRLKASSGKS